MVNKKTVTLFAYIGGKSWLREHLREELINSLNGKSLSGYVEPFAGGLGAFLGIYDILLSHKIKNVVINDINSKLINFYKIVNQNPKELISQYLILEKEFNNTIPEETFLLHKVKEITKIKPLLQNADIFYKNIRTKFNLESDPLKSSVYLLFLQNHCFNGIYRENSKGGYNTPFNWEARNFTEDKIAPKIFAVHEIFKQFNIEFSNKSFSDLSYVNNSLYYLDPPYINDNEANENKYHKDCFNLDSQKKLINIIKEVTFIYSNHDNDLLIKSFEENNINFNVKRIPRKNIISSSNESRKTDKIEILVSSK